jgi:predicted N-acyltransferase
MQVKLNWELKWAGSIADIDPSQWDRLALPLETPILEWSWLHALEASGSISPANGWYPSHLTLRQAGRLVAAAPLYLKTHSAGEFVFDHFWARLAGGLNVKYYPKLVGMSPATPAVGYRFLISEDIDHRMAMLTLLGAIDAKCSQMGLSACQFNFVDPQWAEEIQEFGYLAWQHQSYLWSNPGLASFDDYLKPFRSIQRRNIRRERRRMATQGISIQCLTGEQIQPEWAGLMYQCYLNTNAQYGPWAARFVNGDFFKRIFDAYRHRLLIVAAYQNSADIPIGLSMLVFKNSRLLGRYWGSTRHVKDLHFNLCFYAPIQWAIRNGIGQFDPGAGSEHKLNRGFEAVENKSLHRFHDPRLKALFEHFIGGINTLEQANIDTLNQRLPYARS